LIQIVYATISDMFSMRERTFYLGMLQMMWASAGGLGPLLGGFFVEYVSWRWVFWINLPLSFIVFCVLWMFLDVYNPKTRIFPGLQAVDWYGSFSLLTFMVTLLVGLNFGGNLFAWGSPLVICLLISGILMVAVFVLCERKARFPLTPLDIFGTVSNVGVLIIGFTHDWVRVYFISCLLLHRTESSTNISNPYRQCSPLSFTSHCTFKLPKPHRLSNLVIVSYQLL
jgi:MFS family permease